MEQSPTLRPTKITEPISPATENRKTIREQWLLIISTLIVAVAVQAGAIVTKFDGHPTGLFRISRQFYDAGPVELLAFEPLLIEQGDGYDGQFFYFLAHDPLLLNGVEDFLDLPLLRARRIGYPLLAWALALGQPSAIPASLFFVNLLCCLGAVALLGRRMEELQFHPMLALGFVLTGAVLMALYVMSCEIVALFFLFLAIHSYEKRRMGMLLVASLMAVLCKEVCLLWLVALGLHSLVARRWRLVMVVVLAATGWSLWNTYANLRIATPLSAATEAPAELALPHSIRSEERVASHPAEPSMGRQILQLRLGYFGLPYLGAIKRLNMTLEAPGNSIPRAITEMGLMLTLMAIATRAIFRLRPRHLQDPAAICFALIGLCAVCMNQDVWGWSGNFTRQLYMLPALALWIGPRSLTARADISAHIGFSLLKTIYRG